MDCKGEPCKYCGEPSVYVRCKYCKKCKSELDLRITTELSPEDEKKGKEPKVLMIHGACYKCKIIYMLRLIKISEIPIFKNDNKNSFQNPLN